MTDNPLNYYLIPGLGADHRLFTHFDLKYGVVHYLDWMPHGNCETLSEYAALMAERVTTDNNVLVGVSMGGMVAVELSKIVKPLATVLVSAPAGRREFPPVLKAFHNVRLHRLLKPAQIIRLTKMADFFMGLKTPEQRALFHDMLKGNRPDFLQFSINAVLGWKNLEPPVGSFMQIIGSDDKLFSSSKMNNPVIIPESGHFAVFEKGREVSEIINDFVKEKILPQLQRNHITGVQEP